MSACAKSRSPALARLGALARERTDRECLPERSEWEAERTVGQS
jgi:hypothetical protein